MTTPYLMTTSHDSKKTTYHPERWLVSDSCTSANTLFNFQTTEGHKKRKKFQQQDIFDCHIWANTHGGRTPKWNEHDPFMCPVVKFFNDNNIETMTSCQGTLWKPGVICFYDKYKEVNELLNSRENRCGRRLNIVQISYSGYEERDGKEIFIAAWYDTVSVLRFCEKRLKITIQKQFEDAVERIKRTGIYKEKLDKVKKYDISNWDELHILDKKIW